MVFLPVYFSLKALSESTQGIVGIILKIRYFGMNNIVSKGMEPHHCTNIILNGTFRLESFHTENSILLSPHQHLHNQIYRGIK